MRTTVSSIVLMMLFLATSINAGEKTIYKWVDSYGTVSFTDDKDRIPEAYASSFETETLQALSEYGQFTPVKDKAEGLSARLKRLRETNAVSSDTIDDCGTLRVRTERRQVGAYNRSFYIAEDECGVLYESTMRPEAHLLLR